MAVAFELQRGDEGPRYDRPHGPHGPLVLPAEQAPDATRLLTPRGEARLEWGMRSQDRAALERGVALRIGDRGLLLRRAGRALELADEAGRTVALVRRRWRGRVAIERPGGEEAAWFKPTALAGEVDEGASADEVTLLLLVMGSNAAAALERRVPLPFSPFALAA